jgi:ubiquinone/menaquinone biosynthesis C-methylase UbiE
MAGFSMTPPSKINMKRMELEVNETSFSRSTTHQPIMWDISTFYPVWVRRLIIWRVLSPLIKGKRNIVFLDAGCAEGYDTMKAIEHGAKCAIGVDFSINALRKMKEFAKALQSSSNTHCVRADIENLPFRSSFFDVVLCQETIEHILIPSKGLSELARVTREKGTAIITTMNITNIFNVMRRPKSQMRIDHLFELPIIIHMIKKFFPSTTSYAYSLLSKVLCFLDGKIPKKLFTWLNKSLTLSFISNFDIFLSSMAINHHVYKFFSGVVIVASGKDDYELRQA